MTTLARVIVAATQRDAAVRALGLALDAQRRAEAAASRARVSERRYAAMALALSDRNAELRRQLEYLERERATYAPARFDDRVPEPA